MSQPKCSPIPDPLSLSHYVQGQFIIQQQITNTRTSAKKKKKVSINQDAKEYLENQRGQGRVQRLCVKKWIPQCLSPTCLYQELVGNYTCCKSLVSQFHWSLEQLFTLFLSSYMLSDCPTEVGLSPVQKRNYRPILPFYFLIFFSTLVSNR